MILILRILIYLLFNKINQKKYFYIIEKLKYYL